MSKILYIFFEDTQAVYNIRESASKCSISPMTARKELRLLHEKEILSKKETKLSIEYRANLDSAIFRLEARHYFIKKLFTSGLLDYIDKNLTFPKAIYLFGSLSKGEAVKSSDIDLFIVSDEKSKLDLSKFEKELRRNINILIYSEKEFEQAKVKNKELLNNMLNGIKLRGYMEMYK